MMKKTKRKKSRTYSFPNGDVVEIQAVSRDGYRLIATMPKLPPAPEPSLWTFSDGTRHVEEPQWDDPIFLELEKVYDRYAAAEAALQQYLAARWVIHNGILGGPKVEWNIRPEELMKDPKVDWIFDKCPTNEVYYDLLDAIIGINMPTESGVRTVMESFQSMILDHGEILPLLKWKSRKERKGGMMMNLYAEGLMACKELSGLITLKEYFELPGDPRYTTEDIPYSASHLIAIVRHSNMSSNAVQEIEMEKDDDKKTNRDGSKFDPYWDIE